MGGHLDTNPNSKCFHNQQEGAKLLVCNSGRFFIINASTRASFEGLSCRDACGISDYLAPGAAGGRCPALLLSLTVGVRRTASGTQVEIPGPAGAAFKGPERHSFRRTQALGPTSPLGDSSCTMNLWIFKHCVPLQQCRGPKQNSSSFAVQVKSKLLLRSPRRLSHSLLLPPAGQRDVALNRALYLNHRTLPSTRTLPSLVSGVAVAAQTEARRIGRRALKRSTNCR